MRFTRSSASPLTFVGSLVSVQGASIIAQLPRGAIGDMCWIKTRDGKEICGQIVSFQDNLFSLALFDAAEGISPGAQVRTCGVQLSIPVGHSLLGCVVSPLGVPLNRSSAGIKECEWRIVHSRAIPPLERLPIDTPLNTGIRAIDGFCTLGLGQRIGICASAGLGKTTLLSAVAQGAAVDVTVVALVGERGREMRDFIDPTFGPLTPNRTVIVAATSDDSSLLRQTAPYTATTIAEFFRDQGLNVLLIVDSLTRLARAIRETSIAAGESPVRHGYTNSVYTELPRLVERAGRNAKGSITAIYTVLTNTEDDIDPLADEIKSILDGHITMSREVLQLGIMPAIDITQSISRLFERVAPGHRKDAARGLRHAMSRLIKERQVLLLGGTPDRELEAVLRHAEELKALLNQDLNHSIPSGEIDQMMLSVWSKLKAAALPASV